MVNKLRQIFKDLLEGRVEDQQLGRVRKDENGQSYIDHRAGIDLTFSAPKSVSIMAEVFENKHILMLLKILFPLLKIITRKLESVLMAQFKNQRVII